MLCVAGVAGEEEEMNGLQDEKMARCNKPLLLQDSLILDVRSTGLVPVG